MGSILKGVLLVSCVDSDSVCNELRKDKLFINFTKVCCSYDLVVEIEGKHQHDLVLQERIVRMIKNVKYILLIPYDDRYEKKESEENNKVRA